MAKTGFFAYTDDDWYAALKNLVEKPDLRKTMGTAGREYVTERFTIEHITRKYLDLFDAIRQQKQV